MSHQTMFWSIISVTVEPSTIISNETPGVAIHPRRLGHSQKLTQGRSKMGGHRMHE